MNKKIYILIAIVTILAFTKPINTQSKNSSQILIEKEVNFYKLMYENQKEYNDKILDTVYWSLGGMLGIILIILGSNFLYNFSLNRKEISNSIELIKEQIIHHKTESIQHISESFKVTKLQNESDLKDEIKKIQKEINDSLDIKLHNFTERLEENEEKIKENFLNDESQNNLLQEKFTKEIERLEKRLSNKISDLNINLKNLEAEKWINEKVYSNALAAYLNAGLLEIEIRRDIDFTLDAIIETLKKMDKIPATYTSLLTHFLEKIPNNYIIKKRIIEDILGNLPA